MRLLLPQLGTVFHFIRQKKGLGYFWGDIFTNSSGRPVPCLFLHCQKGKPLGIRQSTNERHFLVRVARWFILKPKIPIWVNFGRPYNGECFYILRPFGRLYGHLV
jgi:hypothetical protein